MKQSKMAGRIKLCVINVSDEPHLTQKIKEKHWKTIKELVTSLYKSVQVTPASRFPFCDPRDGQI